MHRRLRNGASGAAAALLLDLVEQTHAFQPHFWITFGLKIAISTCFIVCELKIILGLPVLTEPFTSEELLYVRHTD